MDVEMAVVGQVEAEAVRVIVEGLNAFNDAVAGYADRIPLTVVVREAGVIVGGVSGRTSLGSVFLELVYLPERMRGSGVGRRMMMLAEAEARRRGCRSGVVSTISFQAPGFYERLGWQRMGEIACDPPGTSRIWLSKVF